MADVERRGDVMIFPVITALAIGLQEELEERGLPVPGFLAVMPGAEVPLDFCGDDKGDDCAGQAYVRLVGAFPSTNFPQPDVEHARGWTQMAFDVEIGLYRCMPTLDENNDPPTVGQNLAVLDDLMADMSAIYACICKTMKSLGRDYVLGTYQPQGPDGACVGGIWPLTVRWMRGEPQD